MKEKQKYHSNSRGALLHMPKLFFFSFFLFLVCYVIWFHLSEQKVNHTHKNKMTYVLNAQHFNFLSLSLSLLCVYENTITHQPKFPSELKFFHNPPVIKAPYIFNTHRDEIKSLVGFDILYNSGRKVNTDRVSNV